MSTSSLRTFTPPTDSNQPARLPHVKLFAVLRINDARLQALAPSIPDDPESPLAWADLGADTAIFHVREDAFQCARYNQGLLASVDGLPEAARMSALHARLAAIRSELGTAEAAKRAAAKPAVQSGADVAQKMKERRAAAKAAAAPSEPANEPEGEQPY